MKNFINLKAADGHVFSSYLAEPKGVPRGGLIIAMEMYGVNAYLRSVCDTYAAEGYLALAPAFFDRHQRDLTLPYDEFGSQRGKKLSAIVNHNKTMVDVETAVEKLRYAGKVALIGFCFGGTVAWLAACRCKLDGAIAYYGSNMCDYSNELPECPVLCHVGDLDTAVPPQAVSAFQAKHAVVHWNIYAGAQHGFDNDTRPGRYHAGATRLARSRSLTFLQEVVG